jgi:hypothetical protein
VTGEGPAAAAPSENAAAPSENAAAPSENAAAGESVAGDSVAGESAAGESVAIATPQHILLYFLQWASRSDGATRELYRSFYAHTLELLVAAEKAFADPFRERGAELFARSPFGPSVRTMGTVNNDAAYAIKMAGYAARLRDTPPAALGLEPGVAELLRGLPKNYYPSRREARPVFSYDDVPVYRRSGAAADPAAGPATDPAV